MLVGVNLVGGEISWTGSGVAPVSGTNYLFVSSQDIDYLVSKGINFVRLLFSWEQAQNTYNGPISTTSTYYINFKKCIDYALSKGLTVLIEPHGATNNNFARYKGNVVGSAGMPISTFANFWGQLASLWKNNKVMFGLSNEPNNISTTQWFNACQAAINSIRATGATNTIMIPGGGFSNALGWLENWYDIDTPKVSNSVAALTIKDPLKNTWIQVHNYFDTNGSGGSGEVVSANIGVERLKPLTDWAIINGFKMFLGELGLPINNSLSQSACKNTLDYIDANSDVWMGWAWWDYGPPTWRGKDAFTLCPTSNYTVDDPKWKWLASNIANKDLPRKVTPTIKVTMTTPTAPISFTKNKIFTLTSTKSPYFAFVPESYDITHNTPMTLFVWLHGCGGYSQYDIARVSPGGTTQNWISIAPSGAEGKCWSGATHVAFVLAAIDDMKTHFNVDVNKIILGGYSSGGDLSYRTAFQNPTMFAGLIAENTSPFRDSGVSQAVGTAVAKKFNVAHIAHISDTTYPIATVKTETAAMKAAGFPITVIELPGTHWDNDNATTGTGTWLDFIKYGFPFLNAGWTSATVVTPPPPPPPPPVPTLDATKMRVLTRVTSAWQTGCCVEFDIYNYSTVAVNWNEFKIATQTGSLRMQPADATKQDVWGCVASTLTGTVTLTPVAYTKSIPAGGKVTVGMSCDYGTANTNPTFVTASLK